MCSISKICFCKRHILVLGELLVDRCRCVCLSVYVRLSVFCVFVCIPDAAVTSRWYMSALTTCWLHFITSCSLAQFQKNWQTVCLPACLTHNKTVSPLDRPLQAPQTRHTHITQTYSHVGTQQWSSTRSYKCTNGQTFRQCPCTKFVSGHFLCVFVCASEHALYLS